MSLTRKSIYAPQPATTRASPTHLSVDPKGERIAYASGKSVFLRSIDDPAISIQYTGHTAPVTVARFSPSGYYVASGDASGKVRIWDCVGADLITKGEFHIISGPIRDLAWDGESKRIIAVGDGKERFGHCITFDTGNSVGEITGQSSVINSVSIRHQRPFRAATASDDQTLVFYHGAPFKFNQLLKGFHSNFVHGVAFSPDGAFFVSGGADRKIFLFDGREGTLIAEITDADAHQGSIFSVSWSKDSDRFATSSADQTVKVWSASKRHLIKTWSLGLGTSVPHQQVGVVWTPREDDTIISLSLSGDLTYLTPSSSTPVRVVSGHQKPLTAIELTASGTLYTGSSDGRVCSWTPAGIATIVAGTGHTNVVSSLVETSPDKLASVGWDDTLRTISGSFTGEGTPTGAQPKSAARISSSLLAVLTTTHLSTHTTDGEQTNTHPLASGTALAASASGIIAVSTQDGTLNLFTASLDKLSATPASNRAQISALAFSPDSKYLAAGDAAGLVVLYAVTSEGVVTKVTERWAFHTARVTDLAWNPAGTHVATASLDTGVFVYSVEKPMKNIKERGAHVGGASGVRWVGENEIVSVGDDGAVKKWAVSW